MRLRRALLGVCAVGLLGGCGILFDFGDYDTSRPSLLDDEAGGGMMVTDASGQVELGPLLPFAMRRGYAGMVSVSIVRNGVEGAIDLTVTDLPDGVSVAPAVIPAGATSGVLTFLSTESATLGTSSVTVHAAQSTTPLALTVTASRLDPTFGDGGVVIGSPFEMLQDVVIENADVLLAVLAPPAGLTRDRFIIYRVNAAGAYAAAFTIPQANSSGYRFAVAPNGDFIVMDGAGGRIEQYPAGGGAGEWVALMPVLDPPTLSGPVRVTSDGKVIALMTGYLSSRHTTVVLRYSATGDPDPTFGGDGGVYFGGREDDIGGDILATDAGILTCVDRSGTVEAPDNAELAIVRLADDGHADRAFADGGLTIQRTDIEFTCSAIATDGPGFLVAGTMVGTTNNDGFVARVGANGALDPSFGDQGLVTHSAPSGSSTNAVAVDADGGIVSAGYTGDRMTPSSSLFVDLGDGGAPNALFGIGDGGAFPLGIGASSQATAVRVMPDRSMFVAGSAEVDGGATWYVAKVLP